MAVKRWTDEMLDELASRVEELALGIDDLKVTAQALLQVAAQNKEKIAQSEQEIEIVHDSVDGLRVTAQALLQVAAQNQRKMDQFDEEIELMKQRHAEEIELMKQRHAENDARFNILLEEVRYLIRGNQQD